MRRSDFIFKYRVRNWPEYNKALISRGSLTFWVDEQAVSGWCWRGSSQGRSRPQIYANSAVECTLVVRSVFHLSLRATQGFLESVVRLMEVDLPVPANSTVCRRQAGLEPRLQAVTARQPRHVVIDTTGLKVYGAGEWNVRKHGVETSRRQTWRKLHLCVDETSKDIVAVDLTTRAVHDSAHLPMMLDLIEGDLGQVSAVRDGEYPGTWAANVAAWSILYACAGMMWSLEWREGRGVIFSFMERDWPLVPDPRRLRRVIWFALPFMVLVDYLGLLR